jgi:hypothetical protein
MLDDLSKRFLLKKTSYNDDLIVFVRLQVLKKLKNKDLVITIAHEDTVET